MKKRKIALCILLAFSMAQMNAFADTKVSLTESNVTVTTDGKANEWGSLLVVKAGDTLVNDNIVTMKQAIADEKGKLVFDFSMSDVAGAEKVNNKYDLYIKIRNGEMKKEAMYYAIVSDRDDIASSAKSSQAPEDLFAILDNAENETALKSMGFDFEKYTTVKASSADAEEFANIFIESVDSAAADSKTIVDTLNKAIVTELININSSVDDEQIEELGFSFEDIKYEEIEDTSLKSYIKDYVDTNKKYATVSEIEKAYELANILYLINNARFTDVEELLETYAKNMGIEDSEEYTSYKNATKKADINEDIAEALKSEPAINVDSLLTVIEEARLANKVNNSGNGGGGSSGGSSDGSSSGKLPANPVTLFPVETNKTVFKDIGSVAWAENAINALAEKGIVSGDENGNFNPNDFVKREEFVKMLVAAADMYNENASCSFSDMASGAWYYTYVASAYNNGLVYGVSENEFGIGNNITRQDLAVMCHRAAEKVKELEAVRNGVEFSDAEDISDYAKAAVDSLYKAGVINGVGADEFAPLSTATRAQAAVMIYNLFLK